MERYGEFARIVPSEKKEGWASQFQRELFLTLFAIPEIEKGFFLAGGTSLSAFYFGHRKSEDIDLFSEDPIPNVPSLIARISAKLKALSDVSVAIMPGDSDYFGSCSVVCGDLSVKVDLVYDAFAAGRERHTLEIDGVKVCVDNLDGLSVSKFSAFLSRGDKKDCLDMTRILEEAQKGDSDLLKFAPWLLSETRVRDCMADDLSYIVQACVKAQDLYGLNMVPFIVALRTMEEKKKGSLLGDL
ncbi:MAG: nucleotidyl transferase AbiEii/AbiGii toxin family protein [Dethiosulfovibrio sp.]|nr:nucleotidyl transferase AbiEii/AbiGii toxin family protein [Dethiosulfovibrio sp.]